jgi:acetyl-CoA carboxylase biotin carboxylase subunit
MKLQSIVNKCMGYIPNKPFSTANIKRANDIQNDYLSHHASPTVHQSMLAQRAALLAERKNFIQIASTAYDGQRPKDFPIYRKELDLFNQDQLILDAKWYAYQSTQGYRFQLAAIPNRALKAQDMQQAAQHFGLFTLMLQHPNDMVDTCSHEHATHVHTITDYMMAKDTVRRLDYLASLDPRTACIFPATGFLAETTDYHDAIDGSGILFGGASKQAMTLMGDKQQAQVFLETLWEQLPQKDKDIIQTPPIIPSMLVDPKNADSLTQARAFVENNGPCMVKASGGGGGAGIEEVRDPNQLETVVKNIQAIADRLFPGSVIKLEKKIQQARHIESQGMVTGGAPFMIHDEAKTVMNVGDRDCSLQHHRAKRLEEQSFAVPLSEQKKKDHFIECVLEKLKEYGYQGPITMEFLYDGSFYFMEANTRIQIEHPVTGMAYGDANLIAKLMVAAALGTSYTVPPKKDGHVCYARIYAEDEKMNPSYEGQVTAISVPDTDDHSFVKIAVKEGSKIRRQFNTQIGEVGVWAPTRDESIQKLAQLVENLRIDGIKINTQTQLTLMSTDEFKSGNFGTETFEKEIYPRIIK